MYKYGHDLESAMTVVDWFQALPNNFHLVFMSILSGGLVGRLDPKCPDLEASCRMCLGC